jgi:uncharacterized protein YktB (UPF0637 family)
MADLTAVFALACKHVEEGQIRLLRQRELIDRLDALGHPTALAQELLDTMAVSLDHMVEDKNHIQRLRDLELRLQISN